MIGVWRGDKGSEGRTRLSALMAAAEERKTSKTASVDVAVAKCGGSAGIDV